MTLQWASVKLGETYPYPIVDHPTARQDYLDTAKAYMDRESDNLPPSRQRSA